METQAPLVKPHNVEY